MVCFYTYVTYDKPTTETKVCNFDTGSIDWLMIMRKSVWIFRFYFHNHGNFIHRILWHVWLDAVCFGFGHKFNLHYLHRKIYKVWLHLHALAGCCGTCLCNFFFENILKTLDLSFLQKRSLGKKNLTLLKRCLRTPECEEQFI